jgi:hypothetical protein
LRRSLLSLRIASTIAITAVAAACSDGTTAPNRQGINSQSLAASTSSGFSGQLLACPSETPQSAREIIGPLGGVIAVGGSSITIPAGAVLEPTEFEVELPASPFMEVEIHAVGQEHYYFLAPVVITIDYSRCPSDAIPPGVLLTGVYIDGNTKSILDVMGGVNDSLLNQVTFPTGHLSGYAIAY